MIYRRGLRDHRVGLAQREADGLTMVNLDRSHSDDGSNLVGWLLGTGHIHPLMNARVELVRRHFLRCDGLCLGPVPRQRMGKSKVLAHGCVRALLASCCFQHWDRLVEVSGKGERETVVGAV